MPLPHPNPLLLGEGMTATCFLFLVLHNNNPQWTNPLTRICSFRTAQTQLLPVLDYSGEQNIPMTTNPDGFLRHFHVICSYGLTTYRKTASPPPIKHYCPR